MNSKLNLKKMLKGKTILVADDVKENYIFLNGILKDTGAKIHWAKDGEEAVVICRQEKVDIVLLDIRMPVMDGYEATRIIQDENPRTTLIAQTAFANPEDKTLFTVIDNCFFRQQQGVGLG